MGSKYKDRGFKPCWGRWILSGRKNPEHKSYGRDFKPWLVGSYCYKIAGTKILTREFELCFTIGKRTHKGVYDNIYFNVPFKTNFKF